MPYDELAALAGVSDRQRAELDVDQALAAELLAQAIARTGVKQPAAYAVAAFRKRRANTKPSARRRARSAAALEDGAAGPPPREVLDRLKVEPELRAMLGHVVAASLRYHGEPVPDWLDS
jgi:hypothetical protein